MNSIEMIAKCRLRQMRDGEAPLPPIYGPGDNLPPGQILAEVDTRFEGVSKTTEGSDDVLVPA